MNDEIQTTESASPSRETLSRVLDLKVEMRVELGRRPMRISEVLALGPGAIIDFQKAADEPLDIFVGGRLVARGEAVVIGERYGVRIVDVVSPAERLAFQPEGTEENQ